MARVCKSLLVLVLASLWPVGTGVSAVAQACTYVELFPGYPEFHGYVTGVSGGGEFVCLEYLVEAYPEFSKVSEDAASLQAAQALGINGDQSVWNWENWVAIEAFRGLPPTCWSCALLGTAPRPYLYDGIPDSRDPRIQSGSFGEYYFVFRRLRPNSPFVGYTDYQLRVTTSLAWGDPFLNAEELVEIYPVLVEEVTTTDGTLIDSAKLWNRALEWGGHFPVPATALPADQVFFLRVALFGQMNLTTQFIASMDGHIQIAAQEWESQLARGETQLPFKDFFQQYLVGL